MTELYWFIAIEYFLDRILALIMQKMVVKHYLEKNDHFFETSVVKCHLFIVFIVCIFLQWQKYIQQALYNIREVIFFAGTKSHLAWKIERKGKKDFISFAFKARKPINCEIFHIHSHGVTELWSFILLKNILRCFWQKQCIK